MQIFILNTLGDTKYRGCSDIFPFKISNKPFFKYNKDSISFIFFVNIYRPQTKLRKGNVFTSVCQEFCPRGVGGAVCSSACWDTPPRKHTPREVHPSLRKAHLPTVTAADCTHPTGMLSCLNIIPVICIHQRSFLQFAQYE